ncbi:MAG: hypothetical protein BroJett001_04790 [Chloroflexota bacterium]|nr:MAG: hypothetical protein BroJett001_04790 [Chloroflexota bacterium]
MALSPAANAETTSFGALSACGAIFNLSSTDIDFKSSIVNCGIGVAVGVDVGSGVKVAVGGGVALGVELGAGVGAGVCGAPQAERSSANNNGAKRSFFMAASENKQAYFTPP